MERIVIRALMLLVIGFVLVGCGHGPASYDDEHAAAPVEEPGMEMTAALETKLSAADRADGQSDHVVAQCGGCGLAMEGSDEHVVQAGEYSLHFCSLRCKDEFSHDLEASLLALAVPEEGAAPDEPAEEQQ